MNVLYCVACDIALTGTPIFVRDVISAFPQNKNCVYTPFYVRNNIYSKETKIYSGNINPSGGGIVLRIIKDLNKKFGSAKYSFDIVHINTSNVNLSYVYLRYFKSLGAKVICHSHNVISYKNIFPYKLMITYEKNFIVKHSDLLLSCSPEAGYAMFGRKARFNVLKNYIDSNRFTYNPIWRDEIREEFSTRIVLGHIGAFNGQKNQIFLLNLMEYLDDRFQLILVGDGVKKAECISYCNTHNLTDRVRFYPSCVDVEKYYSAFDIFLLPSFHEGMGLVLLEATASNLNLIASEFVPSNPVFDCEYLPLDHKLWVAKIQEIAEHLNDRFDNTRKIIDAGYDRSTAVIPLSKYYNELME